MKESELQNKRVAISRPGSGSHLMAYLHARKQGWNPAGLTFVTVDHLQGGVRALTDGQADYFLWEHFTTKPLVEEGVFRRLGDYLTPWPCFVIAAQKNFLLKEPAMVRQVLQVINMYTEEFRSIPSIDRTLANRYGQRPEDIRHWLGLTRWSQQQLSPQTVAKVQDSLLELQLIPEKVLAEEILHNPV